MGDGDLVHFGVCTARDAAAQSTNEAVNFLPIQWLTTGLPRLVAWMHWLRDCWLPMQKGDALQGTAKEKLRAAVTNSRTNELVALHCAPLWCHEMLTRLHAVLSGRQTAAGADHTETRQAIEAQLNADGVKQALRDIEAVLAVMDDGAVKRWLLHHTYVEGERAKDYF